MIKKSLSNSKSLFSSHTKVVQREIWCAVLSYLFIGFIWFLLDNRMKKNIFVKYHSKEALIFWIAIVFVSAASQFFDAFFLLWDLLSLLLFVIGISGFITALNGKQKPLPLLGVFAKLLTF